MMTPHLREKHKLHSSYLSTLLSNNGFFQLVSAQHSETYIHRCVKKRYVAMMSIHFKTNQDLGACDEVSQW